MERSHFVILAVCGALLAAATPAERRIESARAALEVDPNIQALRTQMGATIFADSVRPNHEEN